MEPGLLNLLLPTPLHSGRLKSELDAIADFGGKIEGKYDSTEKRKFFELFI